jgi:HD superfamily phosphohydrolase
MYWQVYLHKTVLSAEQMLQRIIKRAKMVGAVCHEPLHSLINKPFHELSLEQFCQTDDNDVMVAIKNWCRHGDKVLSTLCQGIIDRKLLKVRYYSEPVPQSLLNEKLLATKDKFRLSDEEAGWLTFTGDASSSTYKADSENIHILFKDGSVRDITEVDNALISEQLKGNVRKHYLCYPA